MGSIGAGKATTLNAIAGIVSASAGAIELQGRASAGRAGWWRSTRTARSRGTPDAVTRNELSSGLTLIWGI